MSPLQTPEPSPPPAPRKMTYEEFLDAVGEDTHAEWVDGEMIMPSPVSNLHQSVGSLLVTTLNYYVQEKQLGEIRYESFQMKTGPDLPGREPDVLFISNQNTGRLRKTYLEGPADLAVEIISPESFSRDRGDKFYEYEQGGVREYWIIDPQRQRAEFYQLADSGYYDVVMPDADGVYHCREIEGVWLRVAWLWQKPLPLPSAVLREWGL